MLPWILAGLGMGLLKSLEDKKKFKTAKQQQAETTRYSPWTGMQDANPEMPSTMGPLMQGGLTGAMVGQAMGPSAAAPDFFQPNPGDGIDASMSTGPTPYANIAKRGGFNPWGVA